MHFKIPPEGYADKGRVTPEGIDKKSPFQIFFRFKDPAHGLDFRN